MVKCKKCGKETDNLKYCSRQCSIIYLNAFNKKHKVGAYFNPVIKKENAIKGNITNKKNKTGFWNPELHKKNGKKTSKILKLKSDIVNKINFANVLCT